MLKTYLTVLIFIFCINLSMSCYAVRENIKTSRPLDQVFEEKTWSGQVGNVNKYTPLTGDQVEEKKQLRINDIKNYRERLLAKVKEYLSNNPHLDNSLKENLLNLRIAEGMSVDEVKLLLGNDIHFGKTKEYYADNLAIYPTINEEWLLYFKDNKLIRLDYRKIKTLLPI